MMAQSYSVATGPRPLALALCGCCLLHADRSAANATAICGTCGSPCSCEGCVAETGP